MSPLYGAIKIHGSPLQHLQVLKEICLLLRYYPIRVIHLIITPGHFSNKFLTKGGTSRWKYVYILLLPLSIHISDLFGYTNY